MRKEKPPPVQARMLDAQGNLNPQWLRWFQKVGMGFDDYRRTPDVVHAASATLTTDDFGKNILVNTAGGNLVCRLMTVSSKDVNCWLTIFRSGSGSLTIVADSATRIEYSSYGGRIMNNESHRAAANVTLQLISTTQWAITGATGIWKVL